ncbi:MAG: nucleotide exchange factor GrpE [Candidatus Lokiarchaeota archaeon]|nr:nucleotide exchange factor GrpE [Candidatus Lokiarchaeota archaeon]
MSSEDEDLFVDTDYIDEDVKSIPRDKNKEKSSKDIEKQKTTIETEEEEQEEPENITISKKEYEDLLNTIKKKEAKYDELYERFQRVQADFENYKKFLEKERQKTINYASGQVVNKLLNVLDNFDRAMDLIKDRKDDPFIQGIESIYEDFHKVLKEEGLRQIDCSGKFDPYKHECLLIEEKEDCEEDQILEVFKKGYRFKDKILRPAMVKVAKNKPKPCVETNNEKSTKKETKEEKKNKNKNKTE